jgi:hypothetical protein
LAVDHLYHDLSLARGGSASCLILMLVIEVSIAAHRIAALTVERPLSKSYFRARDVV